MFPHTYTEIKTKKYYAGIFALCHQFGCIAYKVDDEERSS